MKLIHSCCWQKQLSASISLINCLLFKEKPQKVTYSFKLDIRIKSESKRNELNARCIGFSDINDII